ncbi:MULTISPECIES: hypothetical protein [Streptomyces]|uniref:Uncharacterized protein n=1 Tax=Streptomyces edwardsiae TaxID=3075527 RepID=A0ABU2PMV6_9ACTN|nr:hypothetical protein [Streptomyces sp. DSM 41636]MDT0393493.1 hypothetical protein [Streptomyces sp. DSM 41636]
MRGHARRSVSGRGRRALSAAVAVCAVTAVLPATATAAPAIASGAGVERISVAADGTQGDGDSAGASITSDGRHIVFSSAAKNLTADTTTATERVYVRDQRTGQTKGLGFLTPSHSPVISDDGEYAAYYGRWFNDWRIRLDQVATAREISLDCSAYSCSQPSLNADGRHIAYAITTSKLPPIGQRVEVQDLNAHTKEIVAELDHTMSARPSISGDGRFVAYQDALAQDVLLWDRTDGTVSGPVEGASVAAALVQLSDDGGKVVYLSGSDTYVHDVASGTAQLVPDVRGVAIDPTGRYLLYAPRGTGGPSLVLRDLRTGTDETVSDQPASAGTDAVGAGGRDVVFQSTADDIVPDDTNGKSDVFVRHYY